MNITSHSIALRRARRLLLLNWTLLSLRLIVVLLLIPCVILPSGWTCVLALIGCHIALVLIGQRALRALRAALRDLRHAPYDFILEA